MYFICIVLSNMVEAAGDAVSDRAVRKTSWEVALHGSEG